MLYTKLISVTLTAYAFLSSPSHGGTYYLTQIASPFTCPPSEPCNIHCDVAEQKQIIQYNCGDATDCVFRCEEKKCANNAIIYGANAANLNFTLTANAAECFKSAHIYAPHHGNAYFHNGNIAPKGFRGMNVYSGNNTQEIIINCDGTSAIDECKNMNVHASSARFLQINLGDQVTTTYEGGTVECPVDSQYNGPQIAPCIIDATNGVMRSIIIDAPEGIPAGVWITGCTACDNTTQIICATVDTFNGADQSGVSSWPFDTSSDCWWTSTPTHNPTDDPTNHPSQATSSPTDHPTLTPTGNPTSTPSDNPSQATSSPTDHPSDNPTTSAFAPSNTPSNGPTLTPTNNPTQATFAPSIHATNETQISSPLSSSSSDNSTWWWVIGTLIAVLLSGFVVVILYFLAKTIREDEESTMQTAKRQKHTGAMTIVHPMDRQQQRQNVTAVHPTDIDTDIETEEIIDTLELQDVGAAFGLKHVQNDTDAHGPNEPATIVTSDHPLPAIHIPDTIVTGMDSSDDNATPLINTYTPDKSVSRPPHRLLNLGINTPETNISVMSPFSPVSPLETLHDETESVQNKFKIQKHRSSS